MANIVKILWSKITGHVPSALVDGQIAINQKDKKMFYPDENGVVCEALLIPRSETSKYIIRDLTPSTPHTGISGETIIKSYLIPANTFEASDVMNIKSFMFQKTGTASGISVKLYFNSSVTLTAAKQLMYRTDAGTIIFTNYNRTFVLNDGLIKGYPSGPTSYGDVGGSTTAILSVPFDVTVDNYLFYTLNGSPSDSIINHSFIVTN